MVIEEIINKLKPIVEKSDTCGFEVFLLTRDEPKLKKLNLSKDGLHRKLKQDVINAIQEKYLSDGIEFCKAEYAADNQNKNFVIQQTDDYMPFNVNEWEEEEFKEEHIDDFIGIFYVLRYDNQEVWCYQNKRSTTVTNRNKTNIIARLMSNESGVVFEEQKERIVSFSHVIDITVIDNAVITDNIGLLERSFEFQTFISQKAIAAANSVAETKLFTGMDKLNRYLASDAKSHRSYRKKMMKALDSPILHMTSKDLLEKVYSLPRWKGKFKPPIDGQIPIDTNKEIESLIDLLIERFTVSPVSGQEYDTEVKKRVEDENKQS